MSGYESYAAARRKHPFLPARYVPRRRLEHRYDFDLEGLDHPGCVFEVGDLRITVTCRPDEYGDPPWKSSDGLGEWTTGTQIDWHGIDDRARYHDKPHAGLVWATGRQGMWLGDLSGELAEMVSYFRGRGQSRSVARELAIADLAARAQTVRDYLAEEWADHVVHARADRRCGCCKRWNEVGSASVGGVGLYWGAIYPSARDHDYLRETIDDIVDEAIANVPPKEPRCMPLSP